MSTTATHLPEIRHEEIIRACNDNPEPWILYRDVRAASPTQIANLAKTYHHGVYDHSGISLSNQFGHLRAAFRGTYQNTSSQSGNFISDSAPVSHLGNRINYFSQQLESLTQQLKLLATVTQTTQIRIFEQINTLNADLINLDNSITSSPTAHDAQKIYQQAQYLINERATIIDPQYRQWEAELQKFSSLLNHHAFPTNLNSNKVRHCVENLWNSMVHNIGIHSLDTSVRNFPPANSDDPHEIFTAWQNLTSGQQEKLIKKKPALIGNLDGLPASVHDRANNILLTQDCAAAYAEFARRGVSISDVLSHKNDYIADPVMSKYINALQVKQGLTDQQKTAQSLDPAKPVLLLHYEPEAFQWRGAAVTSIGDPDASENVAVLVPGITNSVHNGYLSSSAIKNAAHEFTAANPNTAIVACMNYQAPDGAEDSHTFSGQYAQAGGERIAGTVNGLWASHPSHSPMHMTVIGHSYGSSAVSDACVSGMHTNDLILIGSPGMDRAQSAADLHLDGGHLYVGANSKDAITYTGSHLSPGSFIGLGVDPASQQSGAIRFSAESMNSADFVNGNHFDKEHIFTNHSKYFTPGSESLYNMADIVTNHSDHLSQDHMSVPLRNGTTFTFIDIINEHPEYMNNISQLMQHKGNVDDVLDKLVPYVKTEFIADPEHSRPGTIGHYHNPLDSQRIW